MVEVEESVDLVERCCCARRYRRRQSSSILLVVAHGHLGGAEG
jgi:hypothetical protein